MRKLKAVWLPVAVLAAAAVVFFTIQHITEKTVLSGTEVTPFLLIDPGHGGQDGGASTADGVLEDDINLSVSLNLYDMLRFCGYPVKMTRTEDASIQHADDAAARSWKVNDMHNRLEMYNTALLTISIHQNHFSQAQYHGAQLFYSANRPESRDIADCIRQQITTLLQPENKRELKAAGENIFLLHHAETPALIVECGFLSNPQEATLLKDTVYQQQMAFAICCGVLQYAP